MMNLSRVRILSAAATIAGVVFLSISSPASATGGKISPNLDNYDIAKGDDSTVTLHLDAPIVCPDGTPVCEVTIDFSNAFPAGITPNPSTIGWSSAQWMNAKYVNFTVDANATQALGTVLTSTATAVSASTYYNGYQPSFTITIPDPNAPTPTPTPTDDPQVTSGSGNLAGTGADLLPLTLIGVFLAGFGLLLRINSKKKSKRR